MTVYYCTKLATRGNAARQEAYSRWRQSALFQTELLVGAKPAWYCVREERKRPHAASEAFTDVAFSLATFVGWG